MTESLGMLNRTIRILGGVTALYATTVGMGLWNFVLQAFGLYGILSALMGECIVCTLIKDISRGSDING